MSAYYKFTKKAEEKFKSRKKRKSNNLVTSCFYWEGLPGFHDTLKNQCSIQKGNHLMLIHETGPYCLVPEEKLLQLCDLDTPEPDRMAMVLKSHAGGLGHIGKIRIELGELTKKKLFLRYPAGIVD